MDPWQTRVQRAEAAAISAARRATVPQRRWAAAPALVVPAGECARWLVFDGRAQWLGGCAHVLVAPLQHASAVSPGVNPTAATEAYVCVLLDWLDGYGVEARLAGLAGEPDAAVAARRALEVA